MTEPSGAVRVSLFVTAAGNAFMTEIAEMLADGFAQLGVPCRLAIDELPAQSSPSLLQLVVAPHEFFPLFASGMVTPIERERLAREVFMLNVEQPGSQWFDLAWTYVRLCRRAFDISCDGVRELRRRGVGAVHAPLGYATRLECPTALAPSARPIDVLFLGHNSPRRAAFFARHADTFAKLNCRIVLTDPARPRHLDTVGYVADSDRRTLLGASRILLNVHSTERRYFESHRALLAIASRCLFVSEESNDPRPFVSGRHFVSGALDDLPALFLKYLADPVALDTMVEEGYRHAVSALDIKDTCQKLLDAMSPGRVVLGAEEERERDRELRTAVRLRLEAGRRARARGRQDWTETANAAYRQSESPAITVVVTLRNYADVVEQCLASVVAADEITGGVEIVVVDDASTDRSAATVEQFAQTAGVPVLVMRKHTNTGPADARNIGLARARGAYVFTLDADNWIYPSALVRLHAAMNQGSHAAAYGMLRTFDGETGESTGLLSTYAWDPRELVRAPFIDAMAMFDRRVLLELGGYSPELIEHGWFGWEDYDLWLKLAEAEYRCTFVPGIVGAYRVHAGSMIGKTNRGTDAIARYFHQKFAGLVDRYPRMDHYFGFPAPRGQRDETSPAGPLNAEALAQRYTDLEYEIRALRASKSWQMTAPLRFVFRLLTGRPN
jgi:glycosyltransferase involved in cell wall biosynthesis